MLSPYSLSLVSPGNIAIGAAIWGVAAGSQTARVKGLRILANSLTQSQVGLTLVTPAVLTGAVVPNKRDPRSLAATAQVSLTFNGSPTTPTSYDFNEVVAGVVGNGLAWSFADAPYVLTVGGPALVLFNAGAAVSGALCIHVDLDE